MSHKTNHSNSLRGIVALAFAIAGFFLLKRADGDFQGLPEVVKPHHGTVIDEPPAPAIAPADAARYRSEVEEVLATYSKEVKDASDRFAMSLGAGRDTFAAVRDGIPNAVEPYKSFKKNCSLVTAVATDKIHKTCKVGEIVRDDFMAPIFSPALEAAAQFEAADNTLRTEIESARKNASERLVIAARELPGLPSALPVEDALYKRVDDVAAGCEKAIQTLASADAAVGVAAGLELAFIVPTTRSIISLCTRAAGKAAASAVAPAADGPLPIGDLLAVGGLAWTTYDIWHLTKVTPRELQKGLTKTVDKIEADSLADVKARTKKVIAIYKAEEAVMRCAAYNALEATN